MTHPAGVPRRTALKGIAGVAALGLGTAGCSGGGARRCAPLQTSGRGTRLLVYGGTPSGIIAAIAGARAGMVVRLILGESPLGGMMTSGLSRSDVPSTPGGLTATFFSRVGAAYGVREPTHNFEPHVAAHVFQAMLAEFDVNPMRGIVAEVSKECTAVRSVTLLDGTTLNADMFIDASYEGLLLKLAGVTTVHGRESAASYGETAAGFVGFKASYRVDSEESAGRPLAGLMSAPHEMVGQGDRKIMAYNYRLCLSGDPANSVPFPKPPGYDATAYALLARSYKANVNYVRPLPIPGRKFDLNGGGFFDTDFVGGSWVFPIANLAGRRAIATAHARYAAGLLYFSANDPSVPAAVRDEFQQYGLAKDEFAATGNWPTQLYLRETRRMIGVYVMRQSDLQRDTTKVDSVGIGGYPIDCHHMQRYASDVDTVIQEGGIAPQLRAVPKYQIPFRALLPRPVEATNLLASVCISSTHVAWCSLRVEPTLMTLGEAAGVAAAIAANTGTPLHGLDTSDLQQTLTGYHAVLSA